MRTLSVNQQTKIQRGIMKPLFETSNIINGFSFTYDENNDKMIVKRSFEEVGMLNIINNFEIDNTPRTILAKKVVDGEVQSTRKYVTGDSPEHNANYVLGLYMIDFNGIMSPKCGDLIAEKMRSLIFIGLKKVKGTIFEIVEAGPEADIVLMPYSTSPSLMKHSRIFYCALNKNEDLVEQAQVRFDEINRTTGGSIDYKWQQLLTKETVTIDDISKIADRLGIVTTTPMMKIGHLNNIFFMDAELSYGRDYKEGNHISDEIGENFGDGAVRYNGDTTFPLFHALNPKLKPWMMFGLSLQGRADVISMKAHGRFYRGHIIKRYCYVMLEQHADKCYMAYEGKLYDGKAIAKLPKAKLDSMLAKMDVVGTKDEFKAVNMNGLANGCNLYAVAMSCVTDGNLSNQAVSKVAKEYPEEIQSFAALAARKAFESRETDYQLRFDAKSTTLKLAGQVYENKLAANKEVASNDKHVGESLIKADDSYVCSMTASANIPVNSMYLRLTPDDSILLTGKMTKDGWTGNSILNSSWIDYYEPEGNSYPVHVLEIYCPAFEEKHLVRQYDNKLEDTLRMCVGIKYPSQGTDEYAVFKCVSLETLKNRIAKMNIDNALKADMIEFYETCPNNCVMVPADNTWKNQCAGSDFDGDDLTLYFEEIEVDDDDNVINYGLYLDINKLTGQVKYNMPGFTSLAIRKYAVLNNNEGKAAIITYR